MRTLLVILLLATPCFAQEVETDGLFTIEGTRWDIFAGNDEASPLSFGFYNGKVYGVTSTEPSQTIKIPNSFYVNLIALSIFYFIQPESGNLFSYLGLIQPSGFGIAIYFRLGNECRGMCGPPFWIFSLTKVDDDWTPPGDEQVVLE